MGYVKRNIDYRKNVEVQRQLFIIMFQQGQAHKLQNYNTPS